MLRGDFIFVLNKIQYFILVLKSFKQLVILILAIIWLTEFAKVAGGMLMCYLIICKKKLALKKPHHLNFNKKKKTHQLKFTLKIKLNIANRLISFPILHFPTFLATKHRMHTLSGPSLATKHPRLCACTHSFPPTFLATKYSTVSLCQFLGNHTQCTHAFLASVLSTKHSTHATVKRLNH